MQTGRGGYIKMQMMYAEVHSQHFIILPENITLKEEMHLQLGYQIILGSSRVRVQPSSGRNKHTADTWPRYTTQQYNQEIICFAAALLTLMMIHNSKCH